MANLRGIDSAALEALGNSSETTTSLEMNVKFTLF